MAEVESAWHRIIPTRLTARPFCSPNALQDFAYSSACAGVLASDTRNLRARSPWAVDCAMARRRQAPGTSPPKSLCRYAYASIFSRLLTSPCYHPSYRHSLSMIMNCANLAALAQRQCDQQPVHSHGRAIATCVPGMAARSTGRKAASPSTTDQAASRDLAGPDS